MNMLWIAFPQGTQHAKHAALVVIVAKAKRPKQSRMPGDLVMSAGQECNFLPVGKCKFRTEPVLQINNSLTRFEVHSDHLLTHPSGSTDVVELEEDRPLETLHDSTGSTRTAAAIIPAIPFPARFNYRLAPRVSRLSFT